MQKLYNIIPALFLVLLASYYSQNYAGILASPLPAGISIDFYYKELIEIGAMQACFFYLAPGLICEGYWQVNFRRSIFGIADPT